MAPARDLVAPGAHAPRAAAPGGARLRCLLRVRSLRLLALFRALACAVGLGACAGADEAVGADKPAGGVGACQDYQDALCDWVTRCSPGVPRESCDLVARSIVCREGADDAERCAVAIDASHCNNPPSQCELVDVADAEAARPACEAYLQGVCEAELRCSPELSASDCYAEKAQSLDCSLVIGVKQPGFARCLSDLPEVACDGSLIPESCRDILTVGSGREGT